MGNFVNVVFVFFKVLVAGATPNDFGVVDVVVPGNGKIDGPSGTQWAREVDTHHGIDDGVFEWIVVVVEYTLNFIATVVGFFGQVVVDSLVGKLFKPWSSSGLGSGGIVLKDILVQLYPQIDRKSVV